MFGSFRLLLATVRQSGDPVIQRVKQKVRIHSHAIRKDSGYGLVCGSRHSKHAGAADLVEAAVHGNQDRARWMHAELDLTDCSRSYALVRGFDAGVCETNVFTHGIVPPSKKSV